jgi:hypothetical protein
MNEWRGLRAVSLSRIAAATGAAVVCAALMSGCGARPPVAVGTSEPTASPSHRPEIVITDEDRAACAIDPTASRVDAALAESDISTSNSPLALPQDLDTPAQAESQFRAWMKLSDADRAFYLCLNLQQGAFSG